MKKSFKLLSAVLMTSMLAVSASAAAMPAFAADYTVTINKPTADTASHTYEAYQVFAGTLTGTGDSAVLSDVTWGEGVNGNDLLAAIKGSDGNNAFGTTADTNPFKTCTSAADVAKVLDDWDNNVEKLQKFADLVSEHLSNTKVTSSTASLSIAESKPGYYFIKDSITVGDGQVGAYTDYILKVVDSVTVNAKEVVPSLEKSIVEGTNKYKTSEASIGDVINYQLDSAVPDMTGYNDYYFIFNDTMEAGLTFNKSSVEVYIDNTKLTLDTDYRVDTGDDASPYTFQIVMIDFYEKYNNADSKGDLIKVTYSATLNENAEYYSDSNDNKASLTFANDPNYDYKTNQDSTNPDEPKLGNPIGITPESVTQTYTTALKLIKKDQDGKALTGAGFTITGDGVNTVIVNKDTFTESDSGTYYKLKNGTYTTTGPDGSNNDKYESTTQKYSKSTSTDKIVKSDTVAVTATVDEEGYLIFKGLGSGTYTITESTVPSGYNKIDDITIEIADNHATKATTDSFAFTVTNKSVTPNEAIVFDPAEKLYPLAITNNKGVTLPSTGGMGTTVFYIIGSLMIAGALVLLVVRKRMNIKEK